MKKNSSPFIVAYNRLTAASNLFREMAAKEQCSIGKFLSDLQVAVLDQMYIPEPGEQMKTKVIELDALRNLNAMTKEIDDEGKFFVRPSLLPYLNDMESEAQKSLQRTELEADEVMAIAQYLVLIKLYKTGRLYAHEVDEQILQQKVGI